MDITVFLFSYMFLYNISLMVLLMSMSTNILPKNKTLFLMSSFSFDSYLLFIITVCLFSMAGVPPFIGFFSKLFVINITFNTGLFLLYFILFVLLFAGLYFYMQNMRLLHSSNLSYSNKPHITNERLSVLPVYFSIFVLAILISGVTYVDDTLLSFSWMLV